jgi:hypothetical protein
MGDATRGVDHPPAGHARRSEVGREITQTREEMLQTIEAIQESWRPGILVGQRSRTARSAVHRKVHQIAAVAGAAARHAIDSSFQRMRANAVPAALIGIGAAWLLMTRHSPDRRRTTR